jgi:hypothetical protein
MRRCRSTQQYCHLFPPLVSAPIASMAVPVAVSVTVSVAIAVSVAVSVTVAIPFAVTVGPSCVAAIPVAFATASGGGLLPARN